MGHLHKHPVKRLKLEHRLRSFVETGTWRGEALVHAATCFGYLASVDVDPQAVRRAQDRLRKADMRLHTLDLRTGDSASTLKGMLDDLPPGPALFWLDAHLPERYGQSGTQRPLLQEVHQIVKHPRDHSGDVIIMDDLRLYQRGPYENGDFPGYIVYEDLLKIRWLLEPTHTLQHDLRDEGYLVALPA